MNWFKKIAKNFDERNVINAKIIYLKEIREKIKYAGKLISQSGKNAKNSIYKIITSDKISSYPVLNEILVDANSIALDDPWDFSRKCAEAIDTIDYLIKSLKKERKDFVTDKTEQKIKKGLVFDV